MKLEHVKPQMRVAYIPRHAKGDLNHKDVELGTVSSVGELYVFVRFDKEVANLGWDATRSKACDAADLKAI